MFAFTSRKSGPDFGENSPSKVSAKMSTFLVATKIGPFGPASG